VAVHRPSSFGSLPPIQLRPKQSSSGGSRKPPAPPPADDSFKRPGNLSPGWKNSQLGETFLSFFSPAHSLQERQNPKRKSTSCVPECAGELVRNGKAGQLQEWSWYAGLQAVRRGNIKQIDGAIGKKGGGSNMKYVFRYIFKCAMLL